MRRLGVSERPDQEHGGDLIQVGLQAAGIGEVAGDYLDVFWETGATRVPRERPHRETVLSEL